MDKVIIKSANIENKKEICTFFNTLNKIDRSEEHWEWVYYSRDNSVLMITLDKGKIIGTQGMIPIFLNVNNRIFLTGKSESSLLNPKYRGTDIFKNMYNLAMKHSEEEGMKCIWGFTTAKKVLKDKLNFYYYSDVLKTGFKIINLDETLKKINYYLNNLNFFKRFFVCGAIYCLYYASEVISWVTFKPKNKYKIEFKLRGNLESFEDFEEFWEELRSTTKNLISIHQNLDYVKWRIKNNPNSKYFTQFVYKNRRLMAYSYITRIRSKNIDLGYEIVDFAFLDIDAGNFLVKNLMKIAKKQKVSILIFSGNSHNRVIKKSINLLKKYGYVFLKNKHGFVLKNINFPNKKIILDEKNWYLNGLWFEGT